MVSLNKIGLTSVMVDVCRDGDSVMTKGGYRYADPDIWRRLWLFRLGQKF